MAILLDKELYNPLLLPFQSDSQVKLGNQKGETPEKE